MKYVKIDSYHIQYNIHTETVIARRGRSPDVAIRFSIPPAISKSNSTIWTENLSFPRKTRPFSSQPAKIQNPK